MLSVIRVARSLFLALTDKIVTLYRAQVCNFPETGCQVTDPNSSVTNILIWITLIKYHGCLPADHTRNQGTDKLEDLNMV